MALTNYTMAMIMLTGTVSSVAQAATVPGDKLDLSHWKITLPMDADGNGKVDEVDVADIQSFSHPDYFFLDEQGNITFQAPNKAATTATSTNTRSELRQMLRGSNKKIKTKSPGNNFALAAHPDSDSFASIGGIMRATLKVNHVAINARFPDKYPAYSVVIGQIHAGKDKGLIEQKQGFGWGNEPLKIYYKKWPDHKTGSVFWTYERNLPKQDSHRTDIAYPVWGVTWENPEDPGQTGIGLGESFSYEVNVSGNVMHLTFMAEGHQTVEYQIDLSNNVDAWGNSDSKDHPQGYAGDWHYFKAGAYNQCSVKEQPGFWYPGCAGTGDWQTDKQNGDYVSVSFSELKLLPAK